MRKLQEIRRELTVENNNKHHGMSEAEIYKIAIEIQRNEILMYLANEIYAKDPN